jgi:hypothetical protein
VTTICPDELVEQRYVEVGLAPRIRVFRFRAFGRFHYFLFSTIATLKLSISQMRTYNVAKQTVVCIIQERATLQKNK